MNQHERMMDALGDCLSLIVNGPDGIDEEVAFVTGQARFVLGLPLSKDEEEALVLAEYNFKDEED